VLLCIGDARAKVTKDRDKREGSGRPASGFAGCMRGRFIRLFLHVVGVEGREQVAICGSVREPSSIVQVANMCRIVQMPGRLWWTMM
jgi:hypothetical protein